ncbi:MAG: glycosyltransferase family 4 protein [bacterium]
MKILVISQYYFPEQFRITDICESLVIRGHDVTVITAQPNYPEGILFKGYNNEFKSEIINKVTVLRTKIYPRGKNSISLFLNYISFPIHAKRYIRKLPSNFDIVFINQLSPVISAIPGLNYSKRNNVPSVLYCLDLWPESLVSGNIKRNSIIYRLFDKISRKIYNECDLIAVTSKSFVDKFLQIGSKKIVYLPQYAEEIFSGIQSKSKKIDDVFNFVFAGNIGEMQSVETVILAANELKLYKNIVFHILGTGSRFATIEKLVKTLNLSKVILYGRKPVEEMPYFYGIADAMLVTLKNDSQISMTLPGKVQSYMAAGKPIIAAANGEIKTIIEDSNSGIVVPAEDYIKLSSAILTFTVENNYNILSVNSNDYYVSHFHKQKFMINLEKILKETRNVRK